MYSASPMYGKRYRVLRPLTCGFRFGCADTAASVGMDRAMASPTRWWDVT